MNRLSQDVRYALRSLRRRPAFTAVAIATLALGIGANTAIFSVMHAVLLKPLPFRNPDEIFRIGHLRPDTDGPRASFSPQDYEDVARSARSFESVAAYMYMPGISGMNLLGAGDPARIAACAVSGNFFSTLGTAPAMGRAIVPAEDVPGRDRVIVLSHRLWTSRFDGRADVVGRRVTLEGQPFEVAGVMPASFEFPSAEVEAWVPLSRITETMVPHERGVRWLSLVGRLRPGATRPRAAAEMDALIGSLARRFPGSNREFSHSRIDPVRDTILGKVRRPLAALGGGVALLLLIACVNVANLLIARASERTREISIRMALGATRASLWRQFLVESALISLFGGAAGVALSEPAVRLLLRLAGDAVPRAAEVGTSLPVLAFAAAICALAALLFGTIPAMRLARGRGGFPGEVPSGSSKKSRSGDLQNALVVAQTALAVLLVAAAGVLIRSFWRLTHVDAGIRPDRVLTASLTVPERLQTPDEIAAYRTAILEKLRSIPGVTAAGASKTGPLRGGGEDYVFNTVTASGQQVEIHPESGTYIVTSGYFEALGIPVLRGRVFDDEDMRAKSTIFVVNQALARQVWGAADPVGATVFLGRGASARIVGVVGNVRNDGLAQPAVGALYVPASLFPRSSMKVFLRARSDAASLAPALRAAVWSIDGSQPVSNLETMRQSLSSTLSGPRFLAFLFGLFGALALLLACVGLFGVISGMVVRRTREIGIRMAVGARAAQILRMTLGKGLGLIAIGIGAGVAASLAILPAVGSLLFEIHPLDPLALAGSAVSLVAAGCAATFFPARRAARVDPMTALRQE